MTRRKSRTTVLTVAERQVYDRIRSALGDINSIEIDVDDYCRNVAKTVVQRKARAAA